MEFSRAFHPGKRRATPIPVAPPRIPTPMPLNNNNTSRTNKPKEQITISTISGGPSVEVGTGRNQLQLQHQLNYQNPQMSHHPATCGSDIPMLITKQSYKLLDNDVKTAWINPRLISKIDMEAMKKTADYPPPPERNMNGCSSTGVFHHNNRHPSCGRVHDREWERGTVNGQRAGVSKPRSVPASTVQAPDPSSRRKRRPSMDLHANNNPPPTAYRSHIPKATKSRSGPTSNNQQKLKYVPMQKNVFHHHQSETTSCYVGAGLTTSASASAGVYGLYSETNYVYTVNDSTSSAAAAFFARAAQKLNLSSPHRRKRYNSEDENNTGFCGSLQRSPPSVPPALLRRIGVKEITGVGKVKVMLRVSSTGQNSEGSSANTFFNLDKRKKQLTLIDPSSCNGSTPEDRKVGVAAPKMFAFDAVFSQDDSQTEVCSSALTDVIHAVINGTDGCLFCFGHAGLGKSYTMLGTPDNANTLGIIPCAISWLFKGINEQKQKTGARFSVRVSAVEVCGPTNQLRDLLAGYSNDSEQSPGVYLRDDPLFGNHPPHCELRVPTAEKAAHYLDAAVECRTGAGAAHTSAAQREDARDSHLLFTLHVYQYSVAGKGGVAGGRSRLHLIDLGNSDRGKASGGIPLSGVGNILLGIFNGQKHLPYKEHKLTQLLKDCLSSLTCHAAMIVHVSPYAQNYSDTLTTVQLASRIHRMRRRRIKFVNVGTGNGSGGSSGEEATRTTGTSSEPDPSSSDLSADTVIYVGPTDDATDGEHPPVYIPSLNSGDNRGSMSKILRGSSAEQKPKQKSEEKPSIHRPIKTCQSNKTSPAHTNSPKQSPSRIPSIKNKQPVNGASDEQWIDGPRISKSKVAEARHLMKEVCHVKKRETWIDGPMQSEPSNAGYGYMDSHKKNMIRQWVEHQTSQIAKVNKHGHTRSDPKTHKEAAKELTQFKNCDEEVIAKPLDSKKHEVVEESVIRTGLKLNSNQADIIPECVTPEEKPENDDEIEDEEEPVEMPPALPLIQPLSSREVSLESLDQLLKERMLSNAEYNSYQNNTYEEHLCSDEEVLEIIEVEEPLEPVPTQDCCLQVTEEDIAFCMGLSENPLPEVDQEHILDHPLRILSQENLTVVSTFTDSMSVYTDLERILPRHRYDRYNLYNDDYEDPDNPYQRNGNFDETTKKKFDQLAKLHELFSNRLAKANVANSETYQLQKQNQRVLTRCESLTLNDMLYGDGNHDNSSIYSEPAYVAQKFCENCKGNIDRPATAQNWYTDTYMSASTYDLQKLPNENGLGRFHSHSHRYSHKFNKDNNIAYLRHPDGASNPNLREDFTARLQGDKVKAFEDSITVQPLPPPSLSSVERMNRAALSLETGVSAIKLTQKSEGYDSGHDSTPRTSKHSPAAISRRAESGYDSVVRDSESSSIDSDTSRLSHLRNRRGNQAITYLIRTNL
ncbi:unnamed protein product [Brassicogethes aeneus]|uniref:Kinesin motor domain-containing protein n=1 Tax=Brassicogethes aeneus TaxID=1431903 RepID=A0A9P0BC63_BRAAE|nr:unnamed protein product [Brassicogethes aeneus]